MYGFDLMGVNRVDVGQSFAQIGNPDLLGFKMRH